MVEFVKKYSPILILLFGVLASGILFLESPGSPISVVPLAFTLSLVALPLVRNIRGEWFLLALATWALLIDDISQVAWGRDYEAVTEILGMTLFESFGLQGIEMLTLFFCGLGLTRLVREQNPQLLYRSYQLTTIMSLFAISTVFSMIVGMMNGGSLNTHFIQTRFVHILPLAALVGFVFLRREFFQKLILLMMLAITLKSIQGVFIYFGNLGVFADAEYLVDHYFSMFAVFSMVAILTLAFTMKSSPLLTSILILSQIPVIITFVLNDRRTAYLAVFFALAVFLSSMSLKWFRESHAIYDQ